MQTRWALEKFLNISTRELLKYWAEYSQEPDNILNFYNLSQTSAMIEDQVNQLARTIENDEKSHFIQTNCTCKEKMK